jgi:hypothetical protein
LNYSDLGGVVLRTFLKVIGINMSFAVVAALSFVRVSREFFAKRAPGRRNNFWNAGLGAVVWTAPIASLYALRRSFRVAQRPGTQPAISGS